MPSDKFRLRFSKTGALRLLSHHDLMRCLERMCRRADLPFRSTQGFHPGPRIVLALPLPLGVEGINEVCEVELLSPHEGDEVLNRLNAQCPEGLNFNTASEIALKQTATVRRAVYSLPLPADRIASTAIAAEALLARDKVRVERMHPTPRRTDIRQYIRAVHTTVDAVVFDLWVTGQGTARGDELVRMLELDDLVAGGTHLTRIDLELRDEAVCTDPTDQPPTAAPDIEHLSHAATPVAEETNDATRAVWGLSPHGPVVE